MQLNRISLRSSVAGAALQAKLGLNCFLKLRVKQPLRLLPVDLFDLDQQ